MVRFYDPKDDRDLRRIEQLLRQGGIEYCLRRAAESGLGPPQVSIAEEDLPAAEQLLMAGRPTMH